MLKRRDGVRRQKLGARLRRLREERGLSQGALGEVAGEGLSQTEVSKIENGLRWPSVPQLAGMCKALGVEPAALPEFTQNP